MDFIELKLFAEKLGSHMDNESKLPLMTLLSEHDLYILFARTTNDIIENEYSL